MVYNKYEHSNIMEGFFSGKIKIDDLSNQHQPKKVELGYGKGIGHRQGTYSQYIKKLEEQAPKGNGIISIGKSIMEKDNMFSMPNMTDKFAEGDIPHILVMHYNIVNPMIIHVSWKNSEDEEISEQFYEIPAAHSLNYDWWNSYGTYFVGPEDIEEGDYKVEITSTEYGRGNRTKTLTASLDFTVAEISDKWSNRDSESSK